MDRQVSADTKVEVITDGLFTRRLLADPELNGVSGRLRDAGEGAGALGRLIGEVPRLITQTERAGQSLAAMAENGVRLDDQTIRRIAAEERRQGFWGRAALWIIAGALALLVIVKFLEG